MTSQGPSLSGLSWLRALREPRQALAWDLAEWERIVRLSRRLRLLGRMAESIIDAGLIGEVPAQAARHLSAERRYARWRTAALVWVLERLPAMIGDVDYPLVLLKGAAYIGQALPIAHGRLPSDADILVPRAHLAHAQERLMRAGWTEEDLDEHDRRFYREWSHEVPPMRHPLHGVELDLHHNILPPVAHASVDAGLLLARLQPSIWPRWQVLHPTDQVLHSAAHLFHDSEARDRLRDLVDLDGLLRCFGQAPEFWDDLIERAGRLGLTEPLALACHFTESWLQTPIPQAAQRRIQTVGPPRHHRVWLHALLSSVLTPTEPDASPSLGQDLAAQILLLRYQYRRLPLRLLVPHLFHKLRKSKAIAAPEIAAPERR